LHRTLNGHMKLIANQGQNNRKQSDPLKIDEIKFILNSPITKTDTLKGGNTKRLKASWIIEMDDGRIKLELPKEKNHAGGIKDPYTASGTSFIQPDTSGNIYTPVADIQKILENDYFFISINTPKIYIIVIGIEQQS
ncbi:10572_t:CDS:2, partial [Funneliformis caledonium]